MQLNSAYIDRLAKYGVTKEAAMAPGCYSYRLAAWRIRNHLLEDRGDYWTRVANYHSKTPRFNSPYRAYVIASAARWANWLERVNAQGGVAATSTPASPASPAKQVSHVRISSGFGTRVHPITGATRHHDGIDIAVPYGTPVQASADGRVVRAGTVSGYGLVVDIEHGAGLVTRYAHLSRIAVTQGQSIERGTLVGNVGTTGLTTGPHLHYEVRMNGRAVDPFTYLYNRAG